MTKWVLGVLALMAVGFAVSRMGPPLPRCPACAVPEEVAEPPAPRQTVVDVVDLASELDRPAAEKPFVPFD
jgi:hypothetical protein